MTADLSNLFSSQLAPTPASIATLQNYATKHSRGVTYRDYTINIATKPDGSFYSETRTISSGPNAGLMAQIVPMTLSVTAQRPAGDQVHMYRTVEIALIPVFQFGVFLESDLSYFLDPFLILQGVSIPMATCFWRTEISSNCMTRYRQWEKLFAPSLPMDTSRAVVTTGRCTFLLHPAGAISRPSNRGMPEPGN